MDYERRTYRLPATRENELVAALWGRGALGCEVLDGDRPGEARLVVYYPAGGVPTLDEHWRRLGVVDDGGEAFAERDWLAEYRAQSRPLEVGRRFVVDPRNLDTFSAADEPIDPGRTVLRIPAQNAFGTGSHESTRLCVDLLEAHAEGLAEATVLDVGTGSGILSFVALHLGAARAVGYDLDAPSVVTASLNARHNAPPNSRYETFAGTAAALAAVECFDWALVNVLPERVIADYPRLLRGLRPGGRVISSGNLVEQRASWLARLGELGLVIEDERAEGEWIAFVLHKA
ncbi:MAG: 50S ribosomal protein L11 methyltransferase [Acidobacteriota bacterium]